MFIPYLSDGNAASLTVEVIGLEKNLGNVHIAIYNQPSRFPNKNGMLRQTILPVKNLMVRVTFEDLKEGQYAVATYHDKNGDKKFNQGFLGFPLEKYGFSMGAKAFFSAPDFSDAAFDLSNIAKTIVIDLSK